MKLIVAIVRPDKLNDVLENLYRAEVRGLTVSRVLGHGVGGMTGALLTGVFAEAAWGGTNGLLYGNPKQFVLQATGVAATIVYSAAMSFILLKAIALVGKLTADAKEQGLGMDITQHGEEAYTHGEGAVLVLADAEAPAVARHAAVATAGGVA